MAFEDLKDKTVEQLKELWHKINDNESVIQLVEKYNGLSPLIQKSLIGFAVFIIVYGLYVVPSSFTESANTYQESFLTNRELIRGLFRVARNPAGSSDQFRGLDFEQMSRQVDTQLMAVQVVPTQKGPVTPANRPLPGQLVPRTINQEGLLFEVKKLTVKQMTELAERLAIMHPNTKLANVQIKVSADDDHYFDVRYTLSSLSIAGEPESAKSPPKPKFKK